MHTHRRSPSKFVLTGLFPMRPVSRNFNVDVLHHIVSQVEASRDICRIGQTCRSLHATATFHLLETGIWLSFRKQLPSFLSFISNQHDLRAPHLRFLRITIFGMFDIVDDDCALLAQILQHCRFVRDLGIECFLFEDRRICSAFEALEHIKVLHLRSAGAGAEELVPVLSSMRSKCAQVSISYTENPMFDDTQVCDPTLVLGSFTHTLQKLDTFNARIVDRGIIYPYLTSLRLGNWYDFDIEPILCAFPNLRNLVLDWADVPSDSDDGEAVSARFRNTRSFSRWPLSRLDYFEGTVHALYDLGMICPINHWNLQPSDYPLLDAADRLRTCLRSAQPSKLELDMGSDRHAALDTVLLAISETVSLSHLRLSMDMRSASSAGHYQKHIRVDNAMLSVHAFAQKCGLRYLDLTLEGFISEDDGTIGDEEKAGTPRSDSAESSVSTDERGSLSIGSRLYSCHKASLTPHEAVAQRLFYSVPSMQYAFLRLGGSRTTQYWTADRKSEEPLIRQMRDIEVREVQQREGMNFRPFDSRY